jgi:hypothetical protein
MEQMSLIENSETDSLVYKNGKILFFVMKKEYFSGKLKNLVPLIHGEE